MSRAALRMWLVFLALVGFAAVRGAWPESRMLAIGVIRPPPDCDVGLFEICDAPQGDEQCHYEKRFSCAAAQPAYRRIYRDPFKE